MTSDTINMVLQHAPQTRCFAIGSDELAQRSSERESRSLPRSERKRAARNRYNKWKRAVDAIIADGKSTAYHDLIERLRQLPLDAITLTFDAETADAEIDRIATEIQLRPKFGVGIWEQLVSDELAFIWLWNDK
ncbi:hypothetical protein [Rhodopirellula baltica]|uniref:Uncharacterized protein n=1 Tax=Rhodopirellula baltica SWK14 TaxID=993516 RepID=L7C7B9_RHOBT|nr:hypothetical protein [Rhodopirellula baltica]ELP30094.1 hypothetical protein RBSWK_05980 [Rhodopirellula baltica SWK14]